MTKVAEGHTFAEGTIEELASQQNPAEQNPAPAPNEVPENKEKTEPAPTPEPAPAVNEWEIISKRFGQEFKGEEDFNAYRSSLTEKDTKLQTLQQQYEAAQAELKAVDPMKWFPDKDTYIMAQLRIKHPDLDPATITRIMTTDIDKATPLEILAYRELLKDPKREVFENEQQALQYVQDKYKYDIDVPFDEQADMVKVGIRAARKEAVAEFAALKNGIEVPQPIDLTAENARKKQEAEANYTKMKPVVENDLNTRIAAGLDRLEFTAKTKDGKDEPLLTYELGDFKDSAAVKKEIADKVEYIARNAREWNPEIAAKVSEAIRQEILSTYIVQNIAHILKANTDKVTAELRNATFEKENHSRPLNPDRTNPNITEEAKRMAEIKAEFAKNAGLTGKKTYAPSNKKINN